MRRFLGALALCVTGGTLLAQVPTAPVPVSLGQPGPLLASRIVAGVLATPHVIIAPADTPFTMRRTQSIDSSVIVLGRDAYVAGHVGGDLLVIGGDLHLRPGARVGGRAIAIGGGVYPSTLALSGQQLSYRDFTYDVVPAANGYVLDYRALIASRSPPLTWPGVYGVRLPMYDRSDGLSLPVAPLFTAAGGSLRIEPRVTYRSNLGRIDPSIDLDQDIGASNSLHAFAGRSTYSNDAWIWSDLVNSLESFVFGHDTRNYYRATRAEATFAHTAEGATMTLQPYIGGRFERASAVGPWPGSTSSAWSFLGRHDVDDMLRPNVPIAQHDFVSLVGGVVLHGSSQGVLWNARLDLEGARPVGTVVAAARDFGQATFDGRITLPTFASQSLRVDGHAVLSDGSTPFQRFAFIGGPGTIPTVKLLSEGGDQLVFVDSRYSIPVSLVTLPFAGSPTLVLRHVIGGAGVGRLPKLEQAVGARAYLSLFYVEAMVDPATRHVHAGYGLSLGR